MLTAVMAMAHNPRADFFAQVRAEMRRAAPELLERHGAALDALEAVVLALPLLPTRDGAAPRVVAVQGGCGDNGGDARGERARSRFVLSIEYEGSGVGPDAYVSPVWRVSSGLRTSSYYAAAVGIVLAMLELPRRPHPALTVRTAQDSLVPDGGRDGWVRRAAQYQLALASAAPAKTSKALALWWVYTALALAHAQAAARGQRVLVEWHRKASDEMRAAVALYDRTR
jgi:hypothetical protein